jgi:uncharacterized protein (TIGR02444 family)
MAANDEVSTDGFWRFSLIVYARPGIAEALIGLQDRAGHNVNLILFGLWLGLTGGRRLDRLAFGRAKATIARFDREITAPLRRLRRRLRADPDPDMQDLRRRVLALELTAERRAQARLAASLERGPSGAGDRLAAAEANLRLILGPRDIASPEAAVLRQTLGGF